MPCSQAVSSYRAIPKIWSAVRFSEQFDTTENLLRSNAQESSVSVLQIFVQFPTRQFKHLDYLIDSHITRACIHSIRLDSDFAYLFFSFFLRVKAHQEKTVKYPVAGLSGGFYDNGDWDENFNGPGRWSDVTDQRAWRRILLRCPLTT